MDMHLGQRVQRNQRHRRRIAWARLLFPGGRTRRELTKLATCRLPLPLFRLTCFNFTPRRLQAPCSQTSRTLQPALLMEHVFFTTALALKEAKDAHCIWQLSTSTNPPLIGNRQSVGSCRSRLIGRCVKTMWKLPPCAAGLVPTGVTTAPKWNGAARKGPLHMSAPLQFSTAWAARYQRLLALKSSCNSEIA